MGNTFTIDPDGQNSLQHVLQVLPLAADANTDSLTEVRYHVITHACWDGSNLFFHGPLELGNGSRLVPIHFTLQIAPQEEIWGA